MAMVQDQVSSPGSIECRKKMGCTAVKPQALLKTAKGACSAYRRHAAASYVNVTDSSPAVHAASPYRGAFRCRADPDAECKTVGCIRAAGWPALSSLRLSSNASDCRCGAVLSFRTCLFDKDGTTESIHDAMSGDFIGGPVLFRLFQGTGGPCRIGAKWNILTGRWQATLGASEKVLRQRG
jgi:hypothetical protein